MSHFRKKPVVVEAVRFTKAVALAALVDREPGPFGLPVSGDYRPLERTVQRAWISIETLEGTMRTDLGDWIIREPTPTRGRQFYPVKADVFAATYEPVGAPEQDAGREAVKLLAAAITTLEVVVGKSDGTRRIDNALRLVNEAFDLLAASLAVRAAPRSTTEPEARWAGVVSTIRPTIGVHAGGALVSVLVPKGEPPLFLEEGDSVALARPTSSGDRG